jgi:hypothetical protein
VSLTFQTQHFDKRYQRTTTFFPGVVLNAIGCDTKEEMASLSLLVNTMAKCDGEEVQLIVAGSSTLTLVRPSKAAVLDLLPTDRSGISISPARQEIVFFFTLQSNNMDCSRLYDGMHKRATNFWLH